MFFLPGQSVAITLAGFGANVHFTLNKPTSVVLDGDGYLFIVESQNHRIIRSVQNGFKCIVGCTDGVVIDITESPTTSELMTTVGVEISS